MVLRPMTLGNAALPSAFGILVGCLHCSHQVEPDPAEMAARYGAETLVLDWHARLVCSRRDSRQVDMVARAKCARSPLRPPRIMFPQTVHCSISRCCANRATGGHSGPQCPSKALPSTGMAA
jgi:hypothetical protein